MAGRRRAAHLARLPRGEPAPVRAAGPPAPARPPPTSRRSGARSSTTSAPPRSTSSTASATPSASASPAADRRRLGRRRGLRGKFGCARRPAGLGSADANRCGTTSVGDGRQLILGAGRRPRRGGRPNALFVAAAAEALPPELDGLADLVTVHFPWGSLLRGLLGADPGVVGGIARVMRPGAQLDLLVSVTDRDHGAGASPLEAEAIAALAPAYRRLGLELDRPRLATPGEVTATRSTWGRRLGARARRS